MIKDSVALAYVHPDEISESFHQSVMMMIGHDLSNNAHFAGGWLSARCYGGDALPKARNQVVRDFLAGDAEWLLWIDSDMGFQPDTLDRLIEVADKDSVPIVGALCFAYVTTTLDGYGGWDMQCAPTIFQWGDNPKGGKAFLSVRRYPINSVMRCAGTGSACILIHRSVFDRLSNKYGDCWYDRVNSNGSLISEDLSFCLRAGSLDIPIYVHTGVRTTHHKPIWVGEHHYWDQYVPPHATEHVSVIVPAMRRPFNAKPFMQSLRATTGLAKVYAVCDSDDQETQQQWKRNGARVVEYKSESGPGTFAQKVNFAYRKTSDPWIFICGDDVRFHGGWYDHAIHVADDCFDVVGTNDLCNPRVMSGEHGTHLLIRRSYINRVGASWDGPKVVCHEGYRHNFVDDEIVEAAKQRGVWAFAMGSKVEHLHPYFGKGQNDQVYDLGQRSFMGDRNLFNERFSNSQSAEYSSKVGA